MGEEYERLEETIEQKEQQMKTIIEEHKAELQKFGKIGEENAKDDSKSDFQKSRIILKIKVI